MSVSCSFSIPKLFRAIIPIAGVGYNIYMPATLDNSPVAYMHVVGMNDGTCPYTGNARAGQWCVTTHANNNHCTVPTSIPTAAKGSTQHVCYDFQNCDPNYPTRLCTHGQGHVAGNVDGQTAEDGLKSWIPTESWKFFDQF
jgi:poly(3-hydroxybutyrate) depolymerase